ncbi:ABC transporter permease [Calditrichota bacterium]
MIKNYLKIAIRNIKKYKAYSFINISGLAVGLASFILIGLYIQYELSFDKYHENADQIYRVVREQYTFTPAPLAPALKENFPEIKAATRIIQRKKILISYGQNHFLEEEFYWAGPETFKIFSIPFAAGDPETALKNPNSIVLSQGRAKKYFGNEDPLGKILTVEDRTDYIVTGVFQDMPANSHFEMDLIIPYTNYFELGDDITHWGGNFSYTYLLLQKDVNTALLESKIQSDLAEPLMEKYGVKKPYSQVFFLQPITEIHLYSHRQQEISVNNDVNTIILFSSIAFLILFIACINYMNLTNARSIRRGKEVGIRKVVGARRKQLILQFLGESVTMTILALGLSILIIQLALPAFNNLVERPLNFNPIMNPPLIIGLVFITIFVGLFAGSYPALSASKFKPITVLSGIFSRSSKGKSLRNILVLFQFSITIVLIIFTLAIKEQLMLVKNVDVGYSKEQIITMSVRDHNIHENIEAIKTELLQNSDITTVSTSARLPNDIETFMSRYLNANKPDERITIYYNTVDYNFIDLYDIQIVEGRNFSKDFISDEKGVFLVNEAAVKAAEWDSPIGRLFTPWNGRTGEIVGIMKDFHLHSLHSPIDPLYIYLNPKFFSKISIKINPTNIPATIDYIKGILKKHSPHYPFEYSFFDEVFDRAYHTEQRMVQIFSSFAILAISIACLGLFGLTAFAAEQRKKEIGVRKVMGASVSGIVTLLSKEIVKWILIANLIAWPVAYYFINKWLLGFAYRIELTPGMFLLAGILALVIALVTISFQAVKTAIANPVESLKYE